MSKQRIVLTAAVRSELKKRGFKESPGGTAMRREIGETSITVWETGNCTIHIPDKGEAIYFNVTEYWAPSILYIAHRKLQEEANRIHQKATKVVVQADKVWAAMVGKQPLA